MAYLINTLILDELAADPGSPVEGQIWYNTTEHRVRVYRNGATKDLSDTAELVAHTGNTSNPHTTTLEQARTANNTLAGSINMGSNKITNVGDPTVASDVASQGWVTSHVNEKLMGLDWQNSVLDKSLNTPPGTPGDGDRYIVAAVATGAWTGKENQIAEWDGTGLAWVFTVPNKGYSVQVEDENTNYNFNGAAWVDIGSTVSHSALQNLGSDDHTQYHNDGRALTWLGTRDADDLPEGTTNLYYLDTRVSANADVSASTTHRGRTDNPHTVTAAQVGNSTAQWNANQLQGTSVHTTAPTDGQVLKYVAANTRYEAQTLTFSGPAATAKSGSRASGDFTGTPRKATVSFLTAYATTNYAVVLTAVTAGNQFTMSVESKTTGGFVINLGSNNVGDLSHVTWITMPYGEG